MTQVTLGWFIPLAGPARAVQTHYFISPKQKAAQWRPLLGFPRLCAVFLEESFRFDGRHAPRSSGGDGLPVAPVLHIASGEDARHSSEDIILGHQISIGIFLELVTEGDGIRMMPDAQEHR